MQEKKGGGKRHSSDRKLQARRDLPKNAKARKVGRPNLSRFSRASSSSTCAVGRGRAVVSGGCGGWDRDGVL